MYEVPGFENVDRQIFEENIYKRGEPAIIKGNSRRSGFSGESMRAFESWTQEYLSQRLSKHSVVVHVSPYQKLDFLSKNFKYATLPFDEFIRRASDNQSKEVLYLRSIGKDARRDVSNVSSQFPELDFQIPDYLPFDLEDEKSRLFSSVLRISSAQMTLWTHYDVMDNVLVQISGRKKVVLFPPEDVPFLYVTGDKSRVIDINASRQVLERDFPLFLNATRYEAVLEQGDALFIPALWWHNVTSLTFSVGVNIFWKDREIADLDAYDKSDVYGNKDLTVAANAYTSLDRNLKLLDKLPEKYRNFYLRMLNNKINQKLYS